MLPLDTKQSLAPPPVTEPDASHTFIVNTQPIGPLVNIFKDTIKPSPITPPCNLRASAINTQPRPLLVDIFANKPRIGIVHNGNNHRRSQNRFSPSDLILLCCLNITEFALLIWTTIYWISFRFDSEIKIIALVAVLVFCFMELLLIYAGVYGQTAKNGQNWYRYASHWSFFFTMLLFPNQWRECKEQWQSGAITIMTTPKFNALRILMSLLIILFALRYILGEDQPFADESTEFKKDQAHIPMGLLFLCSIYSICHRLAKSTSCCFLNGNKSRNER